MIEWRSKQRSNKYRLNNGFLYLSLIDHFGVEYFDTLEVVHENKTIIHDALKSLELFLLEQKIKKD